jgi:hypothetical protein
MREIECTPMTHSNNVCGLSNGDTLMFFEPYEIS